MKVILDKVNPNERSEREERRQSRRAEERSVKRRAERAKRERMTGGTKCRSLTPPTEGRRARGGLRRFAPPTKLRFVILVWLRRYAPPARLRLASLVFDGRPLRGRGRQNKCLQWDVFVFSRMWISCE